MHHFRMFSGFPNKTLIKKYILCIYMKTKLTKWGNSYAVRLPRQLVKEMRLEGELQLERKGDTLTLKKPSKETQLRELLKNLEPPEAVDWGPGRGKEIW